MIRIAAVQFCPQHLQPDANFATIERLSSETRADLIVFPELSTSGYAFNGREQSSAFALRARSERFDLLRSIAKRDRKTLVIGFVERDGDSLFNAALIIPASGAEVQVYRKTHLFYKERYCFDEGNSGFFVFYDDVHDLRIGCMICYDWRFPESARSLALQGAELIVCPSNLVTHIWPKVMPARAIENKVYLAVANRWGSEDLGGEKIQFNGLSAIYSYNGDVLAQAESDGDCVLFADIDAEKTRDKSFNAENDIFRDRRPEYYK